LRRGNKGTTDINPVRETTEEDTQDIAEDSVWSPRILGYSSHRDGILYTRTAIFGKNIIVSMSMIVMRVSDLHLFSYFYQSCSRTFGKAM
jgi:hypothetical protein